MQVILLERVAKLGQMGEVVNVKDGYGRNYLLPQGKALRASDANIKSFEAKKAQLDMGLFRMGRSGKGHGGQQKSGNRRAAGRQETGHENLSVISVRH